MNIKETAKQVHQIAKDHGFWEDTELLIVSAKVEDVSVDEKTIRSMVFAQKIALIHSELSEALEADREGKRADVGMYYGNALDDDKSAFLKNIKDTVEDELADAAIRIMDLCEWMNIDLEWHIQKKMEYNSNRPYKHGKQY